MDDSQIESYRKVFEAVERDDLEGVRSLIENGGVPPKITRPFPGGLETPTHLAARKGNFKLLKYLVEKDSSVLKMDDDRLNSPTVLETAVQYGHLDIVKYLVESHHDDILRERYAPFDEYFSSPVSLAISHGHLNIIKYFIEERHLNVDTGTPEGTPSDRFNVRPLLFQALMVKQPNITNYLIEEKKANLTIIDSQKGQNILHLATRNEDLDFLQYVLDEKKANIDINWRDKEGRTLVYHAVVSECSDILEYLVEQKKADVNIAEERRKWTPLHLAIYKAFDIFEYLVDHGADLEKRDKDGATPLHLAVVDKLYREKCDYLLKHGANVNQKLYNGKTALDIAMEKDNYEASVSLIDYSSNDDINGTSDGTGETLVHKAAARNQMKLLDHLVSKKHAKVNVIREKDGWTPLHCAAVWDHLEICKYLIKHGADPRVKDKMGKSPAQIAFKEEVVNYIQNASLGMKSRRSIDHFVWIPAPKPESHRGAHYQIAETAYKNEATTPVNRMEASFFQSSLMFAHFLVAGWLSPPNVDTNYKHLSVVCLLQNEEEHIAEDAIHTFKALHEDQI